MKVKEYEVTVTDVNKISRVYKVKVGEKSYQENVAEEKSFYKSSKTYKPVIFLLIITILIGSFIVFTKINPFESIIENETLLETNNATMELSVSITESDITVVESTNNSQDKSKRQFISVLLFVIFVILLLLEISLLTYLAISDDGGIRFAKLNELRNFRNVLFTSNNIQNLQNEISEKVDILDVGDLKSVENKIEPKIENNSTMNINYNIPCIKTTKNKNIMLELVKSYMDAITEV